MSATSDKYARLSAAQARELLSYDPETGDLTWASPCGGRPVNRPAGCVRSDGRKQIRINGLTHLAHKVAWLIYYGEWPSNTIDHIDGNPGNNEIVNLRDVPRRINNQNQRRAKNTNSIGLLGVCSEGNKYRAQITVDGKRLRLGVYATPEEAHAAYIRAKRELHEGNTL